MAQVQSLWSHPWYRVEVPVGTTSPIELNEGDLISYETRVACLLNAEAKDATFLGISRDYNYLTLFPDSMRYINVSMKVVALCPCTSAAYIIGQGLKYASVKNTVADDGGVNTIAWSIQETRTALVTLVKVLIDVPLLKKVIESPNA